MGTATTHNRSAEALIASPELQLIYETAPIGLAFLSTDCRYVSINQHLTEICGIPIADHIGRSVRETVPQVAEQVEQIVQTILHSGVPITGIEVNGQRADGSNADRVWITYWHPMKNQSGDVIGINVAAEEITDRKRVEAELTASQERLGALNETLAERVEAEAQERDRIWKLSRDLFIVTDLSGTVLNINPAWFSTLGWSADDLVGKRAEWLIHPDDRERSLGELTNLAAGRSTLHFENRMRRKDGSYRWLSWLAVPDREFIYASARDITGLKQDQEQLLMLRRQLAIASQQATIGAMTASITHEIRQPLSAIATNANAALRWLRRSGPNLAEAQAALSQIVKDIHRADEVIGSIRSMFGKDTRVASLVDVAQLVGEVVALVRGELEAQRIVTRNEVSDSLPKVMVERVQLQQVLLNLITNAIEAMSLQAAQERQLTIAFRVDESARVNITVKDTGSGIDPAALDRIFEPFFTTKSNGMGMGLSICRSIIEAHGGELWAVPRSPHGTAFHLALPTAA